MIKKTNRLDGRHYETGSVQNVLALQGVKASRISCLWIMARTQWMKFERSFRV